jgi:hypothetical protein
MPIADPSRTCSSVLPFLHSTFPSAQSSLGLFVIPPFSWKGFHGTFGT